MPPGGLYAISAPSGAGKTTLARRLVTALPEVVVSISHTTRPRRPGEVDGRDYYFVDRATFERMLTDREFLEFAEVFGNWYGTSKTAIDQALAAGKSVILDIDWQGARAVKRVFPQAQSIFILPPSRAELERRLRDRGQDSEDVIAQRMEVAAAEISHHDEYDHVVVNDDLERALADLTAIMQGQSQRARAVAVDLQALLAEAS